MLQREGTKLMRIKSCNIILLKFRGIRNIHFADNVTLFKPTEGILIKEHLKFVWSTLGLLRKFNSKSKFTFIRKVSLNFLFEKQQQTTSPKTAMKDPTYCCALLKKQQEKFKCHINNHLFYSVFCYTAPTHIVQLTIEKVNRHTYRTIGTRQARWKIHRHESSHPNRDLNPHGERLRSYKSVNLTAQQRVPLTTVDVENRKWCHKINPPNIWLC